MYLYIPTQTMTLSTQDYLNKLIQSYNNAVNHNKPISIQNKLEKQIRNIRKKK